MNNGYKSDTSTGSNKRARVNDTSSVPPSSKGNNKKDSGKKDKYTAPLSIALATSNKYIETLQLESIRNFVRTKSEDFLRKYASSFQARRQYDKDSNDDSFVCKDAKIKFKLQPKEIVAQDQGFKDLVRETESVVQECRKLLTKQHLKCTEMNLRAQAQEVKEAYLKSLPKIVELLYADVDVQDVSPTFANLAISNRDEAFAFLNSSNEELHALYCKVHNLESFPHPSNPIPPKVTINNTEETVHYIRGGNGADDNDNNNDNTGEGSTPQPPLARRPPTSRETLLAQQAAFELIYPPGGEENAGHTSPGVQPPFQSAATVLASGMANVQTLSLGLSPQQPQHLRFDYGTQQSQTSLAVATQLAQQSLQSSNNNNAGETHNEDGDDTMDDIDTGADNNNTGEEGEANHQENPPNNNNNNGGEGDPPPPGGGSNTAGATVAPTTPDPKMVQVHRSLLNIVTEAFIKPMSIYHQQMEFNDRAARVNKVGTRLNLAERADKVSEAVLAQQQKSAADRDSLVNVVIKERVQEQFKKEEEERKKQKEARAKADREKATTKNSGRGPTDRGGASSNKKKSPPNQPSNNSGRGSNNATAQGSTGRGQKRSGRGAGGRGNGGKTGRGNPPKSSKKK